MSSECSSQNPHLLKLAVDHLYHLGMSTEDDLAAKFSDVRFVCMGGTVQRMRLFAEYMRDLLKINSELCDLVEAGHRYSMFKVGPVLSVSHGIGGPSLSILLHEILKLVKYARARDVVIIRIGTSGGIDVPAGTVVVSTGAMNDLLEENHRTHVVGKVIKTPCVFDPTLVDGIIEASREIHPEISVVTGKTMCASDFYESQGRLDGAFCEFEESDKMAFLHELRRKGVKNIEMEATVISAMCGRAGIPAAVVCVTLLNRLVSDQVTEDAGVLLDWQQRPQKVVAAFILKTLNRTRETMDQEQE